MGWMWVIGGLGCFLLICLMRSFCGIWCYWLVGCWCVCFWIWWIGWLVFCLVCWLVCLDGCGELCWWWFFVCCFCLCVGWFCLLLWWSFCCFWVRSVFGWCIWCVGSVWGFWWLLGDLGCVFFCWLRMMVLCGLILGVFVISVFVLDYWCICIWCWLCCSMCCVDFWWYCVVKFGWSWSIGCLCCRFGWGCFWRSCRMWVWVWEWLGVCGVLVDWDWFIVSWGSGRCWLVIGCVFVCVWLWDCWCFCVGWRYWF